MDDDDDVSKLRAPDAVEADTGDAEEAQDFPSWDKLTYGVT